MRVLVTGGREFNQPDLVHPILHQIHRLHGIEELAHGGAEGLDTLAKLWALSFGLVTAEYEATQAEWDIFGNRAGNMRNSRMLRLFKPDIGVAFPGANGTADMRTKLIEAGVPTFVGRWTDTNKNALRWELVNGKR